MRLLFGLACASIVFTCTAFAQTAVQATGAQTRLHPGISAQMADAARIWWEEIVASEVSFDALLPDEHRCNPPRGISPSSIENVFQRVRQRSLSALRSAVFDRHRASWITDIYLDARLNVTIVVDGVYDRDYGPLAGEYIARGDYDNGVFRPNCLDPAYVQ